MYEGTSTEQKAKNAKSGLDSMSKPLLQSICQRNALLTPFTQRRLKFVCYFIRRVSAHFIDSLIGVPRLRYAFFTIVGYCKINEKYLLQFLHEVKFCVKINTVKQ